MGQNFYTTEELMEVHGSRVQEGKGLGVGVLLLTCMLWGGASLLISTGVPTGPCCGCCGFTVCRWVGKWLTCGVGCAQHMHNQGADGINKPAEQLVEEADGFAEVFPEHKYEIVAMLQRRHHMARPV